MTRMSVPANRPTGRENPSEPFGAEPQLFTISDHTDSTMSQKYLYSSSPRRVKRNCFGRNLPPVPNKAFVNAAVGEVNGTGP